MILEFTSTDIAPRRAAVHERLGIPPDADVPAHIDDLMDEALVHLRQVVAPRAILEEISAAEFGDVLAGEGLNADTTPVGEIFPRGDHLALFAVTLGEEPSRAIARGFELHDFAPASTLDAVASVAADDLAELAERHYEAGLRERGWMREDGGVLRYSPGYCGWHVSGQRRLFAYLQPERIGLTLTESCLMQPLKSVSGVIIAAAKSAHEFPPTYAFCTECEGFECRERLRTLRAR